jgi:3-hydroxybutyryl-CoA dehydrogenase
MDARAVGVVGAGIMGTGVSQSLAQTSHRVILVDVSEEVLDRAAEEIQKNIRLQSLFNKTTSESPSDVLNRITFSTDCRLLREADFVIENVTESWEVKRNLYTFIDDICPDYCIFAVNTSAIPITRIASITTRAKNVIGMHFMNPVPMKTTVEVIRGYHTSDETLEIAKNLLMRMGKEWIIVNDSPGFVSNRVMMLTINEAIYLLQEQVASVEDVDRLFKTCFGHKMGPLETADLIGLDTVLLSIKVLQESFNDCKYRPCQLLTKMVDAGLYGQKSGQGFYTYA